MRKNWILIFCIAVSMLLVVATIVLIIQKKKLRKLIANKDAEIECLQLTVQYLRADYTALSECDKHIIEQALCRNIDEDVQNEDAQNFEVADPDLIVIIFAFLFVGLALAYCLIINLAMMTRMTLNL